MPRYVYQTICLKQLDSTQYGGYIEKSTQTIVHLLADSKPHAPAVLQAILLFINAT